MLNNKRGEKLYDYQWFYLHCSADLYRCNARVAAEVYEIQIFRLCAAHRTALSAYDDFLHTEGVGYGIYQGYILRTEKQHSLRHDLPDAASLRHPQDHETRSQDAGRLLRRIRFHRHRFHRYLRGYERRYRCGSMEASWRFMRKLDGRLRQHDRRTGCSGYRGDGNGICPCGGFHRLLHLGNVPALGNQPGTQVQ